MTAELVAELARLDELLSEQAFAQRQLRPPAEPGAVAEVARRLGITAPATIETLYSWRDGAVPERDGEWQLFLFPRYYQFLPLARVAQEGSWPLAWCAEAGVSGFPFAKDATGRWLVAQTDSDDAVLRVSSDHVSPAPPDGTLLGLVGLTCRALAGEDVQLAAKFTDDRMAWFSPVEDEVL